MTIHKPSDLANRVHEYFDEKGLSDRVPSLPVFEELFDCFFYASLHTEEGENIQVTIAYYNDEAPKPAKKRFSPEKWSFIKFEDAIPLTVSNLVKLSKAADPWSSTIAVRARGRERLFITGLIDQAIHQQSYLNLEDDSRPDFPGEFHVLINGTGAMTVYSDFEMVASLKQDELIYKYWNVFNQGPVSEILARISSNLNNMVRQKFLHEDADNEELEDYLAKSKIILRDTLSRILNKIKSYGHGGALLISNDVSGLDIKYKMKYDRLSTTIIDLKTNATRKNIQAPDDDEADPEDNSNYRKLLYRELLYTKELKGAIRFVASQSRVDGLILMDEELIVHGFGAVIKKLNYPQNIYVASALTPTEKTMQEKPSDQFGTRHRTMFAFCNNYPGSLGFVVSQDGDIRAITKVDDRVVMWQNIQLQKFSRKSSLIS